MISICEVRPLDEYLLQNLLSFFQRIPNSVFPIQVEKVKRDVRRGIRAPDQIHCPRIVVSESRLHPSKVRNPPLGQNDNFSVDYCVSGTELFCYATNFRVRGRYVSKVPVLELNSTLL